MTNFTNDRSNITTELTPNNFVIHLVFIIVLLAIISLKYYLYFQSLVSEPGLNATRIGATTGHLLMWAFAYAMCLGSTHRLKLGAIAAAALFFGVLTVPIFGWLGVIIMFIIYRKEKKQNKNVTHNPT